MNATKHKLYYVHRGIVNRCTSPNHSGYKKYGSRGIKVCDRWIGVDGFTNFIEDMGERPEGKSIDRIDNDGDYEPNNCRWATNEEQARNKRIYKTNTSKVQGVDFCKRDNTWRVRIGKNGRRINLGGYKLYAEAVVARRQGELMYWSK